MTGLKRWSEEGGGADAWEQAVLRADEDVLPPSGASAIVWSKLAAQVGVGSALVGLAQTEAVRQSASVASQVSLSAAQVAAGSAKAVLGTSPTWLAFGKGVLVGVLLCGATWSGAALYGSANANESTPSRSMSPLVRLDVEPRSTRASAPATAGSTVPAPVTVPLAPRAAASARSKMVERRGSIEPPSPSVAAQQASGTATFADVSGRPAVSSLAQQAAVLRRARSQLRAGDLAGAATSLAESASHGSSPLSQEREALEIELLFLQGQRGLAASRARAFLLAHPESPHASRLSTFTSP